MNTYEATLLNTYDVVTGFHRTNGLPHILFNHPKYWETKAQRGYVTQLDSLSHPEPQCFSHCAILHCVKVK